MRNQILLCLFTVTCMSLSQCSTTTSTRQTPARSQTTAVQKDTVAELRAWLTDIYSRMVPPTDDEMAVNADSLYLSKELNAVIMAAQKASEVTGDVVGWNMSHWGMAQDWDHPKAQVDSVWLDDATHATAKVLITDTGMHADVTLKLVMEDTEWKIDDFILWTEGKRYSEKEDDIQDIKAAGQGHLLPSLK